MRDDNSVTNSLDLSARTHTFLGYFFSSSQPSDSDENFELQEPMVTNAIVTIFLSHYYLAPCFSLIRAGQGRFTLTVKDVLRSG